MMEKQQSIGFVKKAFLKIPQNSQGNNVVVSALTKVAEGGRLYPDWIPGNFEKLLEQLFYADGCFWRK